MIRALEIAADALMYRTALLAALLLVALSYTPSRAAECYSFEGQAVHMALAGKLIRIAHWAEIPALVHAAEAVAHHPFPGVTRAFIAPLVDGRFAIGLEKGGCLLDPVYVGGAVKPVGIGA